MKEVTIKIEEEIYEDFKALAEACNRPVEDVIALSILFYFKLESMGESQKENGVTAHHDR